MQREVAETICTMLDPLQRFNNYVNESCKGAHADKIRLAIAACVVELDFEILEPVYRAYPDLKPKYVP
jgi:hypothetical protein